MIQEEGSCNVSQSELLERLNNPENLNRMMREDRKERNILYLRNILNGTFILLACVAMGLIAYTWYHPSPSLKTWGIGIAIAAVLIKMVEATLRMSSMLQRPKNIKH